MCERRGVYPKKALTIMRAWGVLFAFVGIQLAWNLRPFLGDRNQPFQVFGHYQGNFYTAVMYAVNKLLKGEGEAAPRPPQPRGATNLLFDTLLLKHDSTGHNRP